MGESYSKVYISLPTRFLEQLDHLAQLEHTSRSALIRQAVKFYMKRQNRESERRFIQMTDALRAGFADLPEEELGQMIDESVQNVRRRRRAG